MDSARGPAPRTGSWDAAGFLRVWRRLDPQGRGYLDDKELDAFCRQMLTTLGTDPAGSDHPMAKGESGEAVMDENVQKVKQQLVAAHDLPQDGPVRMDQLARVFLSEDENFLLLFRQESPLDSSVEFMQIWRKYDADRSGFISAAELQNFLRDLLLRRRRPVSEAKLEEYAGAMMKVFDRNQDGRLDLSDLARILALQENFLLQFKMDACSTEERKRDFEKIFAHYDVSETGALEGPEVDGFVKDMMELVQPSVRGVDLERFRESLLRHCDANGDGKIQKSELALCLGLRSSP